MTLKDRVQFLTTPEEVDQFLKANQAAAIFKVGNCHKTQETFTHVQKHLEARDDLPLGIIRVLECAAREQPRGKPHRHRAREPAAHPVPGRQGGFRPRQLGHHRRSGGRRAGPDRSRGRRLVRANDPT